MAGCLVRLCFAFVGVITNKINELISAIPYAYASVVGDNTNNGGDGGNRDISDN
jgi:hypothetical protein